MKRNMFLTVGVAAVLSVTSLVASAGLVGSTVNQCGNSAFGGSVTADPASCDPLTAQASPASAVVGAGVEFSLLNSGSRTFDFDDDSLTIVYNAVGSPSPDLWIFEFDFALDGISLIGANVLGLTFTSSANRLGVLIGAPLVNGTAVLKIQTSVVPEPGTFVLAALAGLILLQTRRRRR